MINDYMPTDLKLDLAVYNFTADEYNLIKYSV